MNSTHHGADQPLDMAAIVRAFHRSVLKFDAVLGGATQQCLAMEFPAIVDMDDVRQAKNWPIAANGVLVQPLGFVHHQVLDSQCHRRRRWALQCQIEADDHSAGHINGEG